jgi:hypothetical protein
MSEYTPSTEDVLYDFAKPIGAGVDDWDVRVTAFERWLAGVKADAWDERHNSGAKEPRNPYREATE